ncbi:MAG: hypothetical protein WCE90_01885 [Candidatus Zixiibacteriota bacterium]
MKKLITCLVFLIVLVYSGNEISAGPSYQMLVHGRDNCVFLDTSVAARRWLPQGTYLFTASGTAYYEPGSPFRNLLFRHRSSANHDSTRILEIGHSVTVRQGIEYYCYAMLIDWSDTTNNSGAITLDISGNPLTINARANCITLNSSPAVMDTLPPGEYRVDFSGNAGFPDAFTEIVIHYKGINGDVTDVVEKGTPKQITLRSGSPNISAFFLDWAFLVDNVGVGVVTLTPISENIPTLTEWGLIIFGVVLLGFITWVFLKKRRRVIGVRV